MRFASLRSFTIDELQAGEVGDLLALQKANLRSNVSPKVAFSEGFVTFQYSPEIMMSMLSDMPQPIAKHSQQIVGYALATSLKAASQIALLHPLIALCQNIQFRSKPLSEQSFYFIGQVCVREGWRGLGVFDALYERHKQLFSGVYDCVITEVAEANPRSMAAHKRVGFQTIHQYEDNGNLWNVVAWDFSNSKPSLSK